MAIREKFGRSLPRASHLCSNRTSAPHPRYLILVMEGMSG